MYRINDFNDYLNSYEKAQTAPADFWGHIAKRFDWMRPWNKVLTGDFNNLPIKWYEGATLNITENCLDRHLELKADHTALIFEPNDPKQEATKYTYQQLHHEVCLFANVLKAQGIKKGDVVCFYMAMVPDLMIGILACARIGAIHSVIFGGFSANALASRINDSQAKMLITNDGGHRGKKIIPLKEIADEALKTTPSIRSVIVSCRTKNSVAMKSNRDYWLHDLKLNCSPICVPTECGAEDPLFILYTSGSTGSPKGLLHTQGGYMVYTGYTFENVFQMQDDDIYWCTADIGWITGHSYLTYGALLNGKTTLMYEGIPTFPDAGRFWEVIDKYQVTHFYTAPTAIRALQKEDLQLVKKHNLSSLKVLGTVGEPINQEAWDWYNENIGNKKCPIVDTWWQTETGGIMISALANITPIIPTYATYPIPGIDAVIVDKAGKIMDQDQAEGNLCIKTPWPGIARSIYGDAERYRQTYFTTYPGLYFCGDGAKRDEKGNYRITGRVDDVINVSGHRIGTAEVENAINQHEAIVESAVVGFNHEIKGQGIHAYVIPCKEYSGDIEKELSNLVVKLIGPIARPDKIQIVSGLPKTRSGKIMRRILKKLAAGETKNLGDTSTLLNPEIIKEIIS